MFKVKRIWHHLFGHPQKLISVEPNPYISRVQVSGICSCGLFVIQNYDGKKHKKSQVEQS